MITLRPTLFRKVAIIGVGLIGGSLAKALKKNRLAKEVVGVGQNQQTLANAVKDGVIDQAFSDATKAVVNADLVVLAAPVGVILATIPQIASHLRRGCVVTDVGSSKAAIVAAAHKHFPPHVFFVGSHPIAGSEKSGVSHASAELFEKAVCLMTPVEATHRMAKERVKVMWTKVGANVKSVTPQEHDRILGYVSHLPHVIAFSLMETVPSEFVSYAAQGLKDTTRIAASSPQMWNDICVSNKHNVIQAIDEIVKNLSVIRRSISTDDQKALLNVFKNAKTKRESIS